ncbi:MAG: ABC transporter ATP-binding protein [Syntrophomonadaceae bacterium]|nr:ABC transporter ATP-binding protein [Syntrophomonadaceae bacterium]
MIRLQNISKTYVMGRESVKALQDVSLSIDQGDFLAIVGPSGSGKSTLMHIIGCLDVPDSGEYYLNGIMVSSLSDDQLSEIRNLKIGFVFQRFNLLPRLTALENVELPLIYRAIPEKERREQAYRALEQVGLADRVKHKPVELSGGQQQRVAIARALVGNPPVILADEPTGALDSSSGRQLMDLLSHLNQAGITLILITHDWNVAQMAKRIIEIRDGQIIREGVN